MRYFVAILSLSLLTTAGAQDALPLANNVATEGETTETRSTDAGAPAEPIPSRSAVAKSPIAKLNDSSTHSVVVDESPSAAPNIYYLPDGEGKLRRVVGFQYEDFLKAWGLARVAAREMIPPPVVLQALDVKGVERGDAIELDVHLEFALSTDRWVTAPIQFGSLIVTQADFQPGANTGGDESHRRALLSYVRPGDHRTDSDQPAPDRPGNLAVWLKGKPGTTQKVLIKGFIPVEAVDGARSVNLSLPQATASHVELQISGGDVNVNGVDHAGVAIEPFDDKAKRVLIDGATGTLGATWRRLESEQIDRSRSFEAVGELAIDVDVDRTSYTAAYLLNSLGRELDRVYFQLPAGSELTSSGGGGGYTLEVLADDRNGASRAAKRADRDTPPAVSRLAPGKVVEVRFDQPVESPTIRFTAETLHNIDDGEQFRRIGGPQIIGAFRQYGNVALTIDKRLQSYFDPAGSIEQIARGELPEGLRNPASTAALAFSGTDWSIQVTTRSQQRRVRVKPSYELGLHANHATLEMDLEYQVAGGRIFEVRVDLKGWSLTDDAIESGGLIDRARVVSTKSGQLRLPMRDAVDDAVRLRLTLRRPAELGVNSWPLPVPEDAHVLPGSLLMTSSPELQATPMGNRMVGVSRAQAGATAAREDVENPAIEFDTFSGQTTFSAELVRRNQLVVVDVETTAAISMNRIELEQQFSFDVKYEPLDDATFLIPADLLEGGALQWEVDGESLPAPERVASGNANYVADRERTPVRVKFPQPVMGTAVVSVTRAETFALERDVAATSTRLALVAPADRVRHVFATINTTAGLDAKVIPSGEKLAWSLATDGDARAASLRYASTGPSEQLPLEISVSERSELEPLTIEKAWVQTWLAGNLRQDRTVYQIHTARDELEVLYPSAELGQPIEVVVDGRAQRILRDDEGVLRVALVDEANAGADRSAEHVIEFRTRTPQPMGQWESLTPLAPRIVGAESVARAFWQVIVPNSYSAASTPKQMSADYHVGWSDFDWGRQPSRSSNELERWIGAAESASSSSATHAYLFSGFELPSGLSLVVVQRAWILAGVATAMLLAAALLLNTGLGRRPEAWLATAVTLFVLAALYPESAVLLMQGLFMAGATAVVINFLRVVARPSVLGHAPNARLNASIQTATTDIWPPQATTPEPTSAAPAEPLTTGGGS